MKKYYERSHYYEEQLEEYDYLSTLTLTIDYDEGCFNDEDNFRADLYVNLYDDRSYGMDYITSLRAYSFYNQRPTDEQRKTAIRQLIYELRENGYKVI